MKKLARLFIRLIIWFTALSVIWVLVNRFVPVPYTLTMLDRRLKQEQPLAHDWISSDMQSVNAQLAIVCAEDQKFLHHHGFDYEAIRKAYDHNQKGGRLRGASTISQQTAKNVFLWQGRSWLRKGLEAWFTFLIENLWGKERILEVYLNSAEMGPGVFGIEAASRYWFEKSAHQLSRYEAAAIAAILPNPTTFKANPRTKYIESRKRWILAQMVNFGSFSAKKESKTAKNE